MMRIDCRFPGGNIKVHDIFEDTIFISPDLRGASVSWFYWAFRVTGAEGRTLVFRFLSDYPVGTRGPAISTDGRKSWYWTNEAWDQGSFRISIPWNVGEIFVAFAPTYTQENWDEFVGNLLRLSVERKGCPSLAVAHSCSGSFLSAETELDPSVAVAHSCSGSLLSADPHVVKTNPSSLIPNPFNTSVIPGYFAESKKGRQVEILHAGAIVEKASRHVVVTARHYCSEMVANLVMEGMIFEIALGEGAEAKWLRENVSFSFVPFVDKDGVEDGDQGRGRMPHDFGLDYGEKQIYRETAAVRNLCKTIIRRYGKLDLFLDLKCPWIRGGMNETVHFAGNPERSELRNHFGECLESQISASSLPFCNAESCGMESELMAEGTMGPETWASIQPEVVLATSLEIPYATAHGTEVTWDRARLLGAAFVRTVADMAR